MTQKENQPKYFYVGQTVYHPFFGEGKVVSIDCDIHTPVNVDFIRGSKRSFTEDGRALHGDPLLLSQKPIPEIKNEPLPESHFCNEGDLVWVRGKQSEDWLLRFFKNIEIENDQLQYRCYHHGHIGGDTALWRECQKFQPETIDNYRVKK